MPTQLRWLASLSASTFHAAVAIRDNQTLTNAELANALIEPADLLAGEFTTGGLDESKTLAMFAGLASGIENNRELATVALTKIRGRNETTDGLASRVAGRIADAEAAFRKALPNALEELAARGQPLKDQWDMRGDGLLMRLGQRTDPMLIPPRADVALVYPVLGGHGVAHLSLNTVRIEAVLTKPNDSLPEVVRLAWLLGQLQCDIPIFGERIVANRLPKVAALAMVCPVLESAEYMELVRRDDAMIGRALMAWRIADSEAETSRLAGMLREWWETYLDNPPHWSVALTALDRMVG